MIFHRTHFRSILTWLALLLPLAARGQSGSFEFSAPSYAVNEGASATITVRRVGRKRGGGEGELLRLRGRLRRGAQ